MSTEEKRLLSSRTHRSVKFLLLAGARLHSAVSEKTHCLFQALHNVTAQSVGNSQPNERRPSGRYAADKLTVTTVMRTLGQRDNVLVI